jgi:radical SAM protein with 4Fe4S-binding SPASM domain
VERQGEIVSYICRSLGASTVRLEPVYGGRRDGGRLFAGRDADCFVNHFLEAQALAASFGGTASFSGIRPDEIHGPYCDILRNVLRLTPDGTATACFFSLGAGDPLGRSLQIGGIDESTKEFILDRDKIDDLKRRAGDIPDACSACINVYSCSRSCPDACSALHRDSDDRSAHAIQKRESALFRCLVHRKLALVRLLGSVQYYRS